MFKPKSILEKTKLIFETREGWDNIYIVRDETTLAALNNGDFCPNKGTRYSGPELYEIADEMEEKKGNPSRRELFEAHTLLRDKNARLRGRITKLMQQLKMEFPKDAP